MALSKEQFRKKWEGTHTELQLVEGLKKGRGRGNLVRTNPGDKNISPTKYIPGQSLIEQRAKKDQTEKFKEMVFDATDVRAKELLDIDYAELLRIAVRMVPTKVEQSGNVNFTFGDMVRKANITLEKVDTIEDGEIVEDNS